MIGKQLNRLLKKHNVSAYKVAIDLGIDHASMSRYRKDTAIPKAITLKKIAEYFDEPVSKFFEE